MSSSLKALVLGSGESARLFRYGAYIDEFDIVVRFNQFFLDESFAPFAGTKTDVWCLACADDVFEACEQHVARGGRIPGQQAIINFNWNSRRATERKDRMKAFISFVQQQESGYPVRLVSQESQRQLSALLGDEAVLASSGLLAIFLLLDDIEQVVIHGFDKLDPNIHGFRFAHYWTDALFNFWGHNFDNEATLIKTWIQEGRVRILHDYLTERGINTAALKVSSEESTLPATELNPALQRKVYGVFQGKDGVQLRRTDVSSKVDDALRDWHVNVTK